MKQPLLIGCRCRSIVAPRTGAWIETEIMRLKELICKVAPRTGAWIETITMSTTAESCPCRPPHGGVD